MDIDTLLGLDDPILEVRFHAGNPAYSDGRFEYFKSRLGYYESELKRKHVTRRILWQEYRREQEQGVWLYAILLSFVAATHCP